jgi:hypothetical protein
MRRSNTVVGCTRIRSMLQIITNIDKKIAMMMMMVIMKQLILQWYSKD